MLLDRPVTIDEESIAERASELQAVNSIKTHHSIVVSVPDLGLELALCAKPCPGV